MNHPLIVVAVICAIGLSACSMFQKKPAKGTPEASAQLLLDGEKRIAAAETRYRDAVLTHGESSDEAVQAKTAWHDEKNKYAANQTHVQQLQKIDAQGRPYADPTAPTSGNMYPNEPGGIAPTPASR